jgi:hypothetical protein
LKLFVAHWILSRHGEPFYQLQLVIACGNQSTNGLKPLAEFIRLGMVQELPNGMGARRKYYRQTSSVLWDAISLAIQATNLDPYQPPQIEFVGPVMPTRRAATASRAPRNTKM